MKKIDGRKKKREGRFNRAQCIRKKNLSHLTDLGNAAEESGPVC